MVKFLFLILAVFILGGVAENAKDKMIITGKSSNKYEYQFIIIVITIILILFAGLRTTYNDTAGYMKLFEILIPNDDLSFKLNELFKTQYYGFDVWQRYIKHFFGKSQWLTMIDAIVAITVFMKFLTKYTKTLQLTLYGYIVIGSYVFSMAAQKQILAMSISLFAIEFLLKKEYIRFYALIVLAYTFHPYILTLAILPLLLDDVWSKKMMIITIIAVVLSFIFTEFIAVLLNMANEAGVGKDNYTVAEMTDHTINPIRVIVDGIPIFISWILRKEINEKGDDLLKLGINMQVITWLMTFASLFGNPIYLYRTGLYFSSYIPVVVPWMLVYCLPERKWKKIFIIGYMLFYLAVLVVDLWQLYGFALSADPFKHTTLKYLFSR